MFLSIKRHLDGASLQAERKEALLRFVRMLLSAQRMHSLHGEEGEYARFQADLASIEARVADDSEPADILIQAGSAVKCIEEYSHHANRFVRLHVAELHNMISMLTETVATVSEASSQSVSQLQTVERQIERASQQSDLLKMKEQLADCLELVRQETERHRKEAQSLSSALERTVHETRARLQAHASEPDRPLRSSIDQDHETGLFTRGTAEEALSAAVGLQNFFAVVLPLDRKALIKARFGAAAAESAFQFFSKHIRDKLTASDEVFRWNTATLVLVIHRDAPMDVVRAEFSRFASQKLEYTVESNGREVLLPLTSTWTIFSIHEANKAEQLINKIDQFLNSSLHSRDSFH